MKISGASGVGGIDLSVDYDTTALKFVKGEAGPLAQNGMIEANEVQPGTVNIGVVDSQGITGNGNVVLLTFDVVGIQGTSSRIDVVVRARTGPISRTLETRRLVGPLPSALRDPAGKTCSRCLQQFRSLP